LAVKIVHEMPKLCQVLAHIFSLSCLVLNYTDQVR